MPSDVVCSVCGRVYSHPHRAGRLPSHPICPECSVTHKWCHTCKMILSVQDFQPSHRARPGRECRKCIRKRPRRATVKGTRDRENEARRRSAGREYIAAHRKPCVVCGESRLAAIQFHHVDQNDPSRVGMGSLQARSIKRIDAEILKCICLCGTCHLLCHAGDAATTQAVARHLSPVAQTA